MLTIKNYNKIIGCVVGKYQITKVQELNNTYEIMFFGPNRRQHKIVYIDRRPLSEYEKSVYKVVCDGEYSTIFDITLKDMVATIQYIAYWLEINF